MSVTPSYRTLGKFTPTPPVQSEEMKAAYQQIKMLEATLEECREYIEEQVDVIDGSNGEPMPNRAMALVSMIDESLHGAGNF